MTSAKSYAPVSNNVVSGDLERPSRSFQLFETVLNPILPYNII